MVKKKCPATGVRLRWTRGAPTRVRLSLSSGKIQQTELSIKYDKPPFSDYAADSKVWAKSLDIIPSCTLLALGSTLLDLGAGQKAEKWRLK